MTSAVILIALLASAGARPPCREEVVCDGVGAAIVSERYPAFHYEGEVDGTSRLAHGSGTITWFDAKRRPAFTYTGRFVNGKMNGQGRCEFLEAGCVYEGDWERGEPANGRLMLGSVSTPEDAAGFPEDALPDDPPELLDITAPELPPFAFRRRLAGRVTGLVRVGPDGRVHGVRVDEASHPCFVMSFVDALMTARFRPARREKKPAAAWVSVPMSFSPEMSDR